MKKRTSEFVFILISTAILLIFNHYSLLEQSSIFALLPIMAAYYLGQYSERKFKK